MVGRIFLSELAIVEHILPELKVVMVSGGGVPGGANIGQRVKWSSVYACVMVPLNGAPCMRV